MKLHYFDQPAPDADDLQLQMAIQQGYVPATCRLGGAVVMAETRAGRDACAGCSCDRAVCRGRPKRQEQPKPAPVGKLQPFWL